jgi:hypothetical protein
MIIMSLVSKNDMIKNDIKVATIEPSKKGEGICRTNEGKHQERDMSMKMHTRGDKRITAVDVLVIISIIITAIITITGATSFRTGKSYDFTNQYGDAVEIFGNGIYEHDSLFKAPIFIGTDLTILVLVLPMLVIALVKEMRKRTLKTKLTLLSVLATLFYYAASISFGVTYNRYFILYIALFSCSMFSIFVLVKNIDSNRIKESRSWKLPTRGIVAFLMGTGLILMFIWLSDIISALIAGKPLSLIDVYTTEITYVIDLGLISPLCFVCIYLLKKKEGLGDILLAILLKACIIIGIMMIPQTVFQLLAGIDIPLPAMISKSFSFTLLAVFALIFNRKYYKSLDL